MKIKSVLVFLVFLIMTGFIYGQTSECSPNTRSTITDLCARALSYPDDFLNHVKVNSDKYPRGGSWEKCAKRLVIQLVRTTSTMIPHTQLKRKAKNIASSAGFPDLWPKIIELANYASKDTIRLASWINAITNATLEIKRGNTEAYQQTDPFRWMSNIWQQTQQSIDRSHASTLQKLSYELIVWIIFQYSSMIE